MHSNAKSKSFRLSMTIVALILLAVVLPLITSVLKTSVQKSSAMLPASAGGSPFTVLLNSLRASVGDTIFMKTEIYLHEGVNYFSMDNDEHDEHHGHDHAHEHEQENLSHGEGVTFDDIQTSAAELNTTETQETDHRDALANEDVEHLQTLIPKEHDDFRSFIGTLERKVKPWRAEHIEEHGKGIELVPWYRVATLADPHNVRCYIIGAWWLSSAEGKGRYKDAENFIREGITNNPDDFQLKVMLGELLEKQDQKKDAFEEFRKGFECGLHVRPKNGTLGQNWTTYEETDFMTAAHMMVFLTRDTETTDAAILLAEKLSKQVPDLLSMKRILNDMKSSQNNVQ